MKRSLVIYGVATGLVIVLLQIFHYKVVIHDFTLEWFGLGIGLVFLVIGIFFGSQLTPEKDKREVNKAQALHVGLSTRETDVLLLMVEGLSNQEIADGLFVSLHTIKTHVSNIYGKLHVKRRAQAIKKALELEIIPSKPQNHTKV